MKFFIFQSKGKILNVNILKIIWRMWKVTQRVGIKSKLEYIKHLEYLGSYINSMGASLVAQLVKNLLAMQETCNSWVGKFPWRKDRLPLQYSSLENLHGQRSLAVCGPWGPKELDMTERLSTAQQHKLNGELICDSTKMSTIRDCF